MAGIYFHIPFCKKACHYCDFHFSTSIKEKEDMLHAMHEEIRLQKDYLSGQTIETIYFGGGTPSILQAGEIRELIDTLSDFHSIAANAEITLEANPDDLSTEKVKELRQTGINRFSIGIQSFFDEDLKWMNRAHQASEAENCIKRVQDAGFENITADLIYGFPLLTDEKWKSNIQKIIEFAIPHISAYSMTVEPRTALAAFISKGNQKPMDEAQSSEQFLQLMNILSDAGFDHYEISNFAAPGKYSRHNSNYWKGIPYLGIGPSAHSFDSRTRQWNIASNLQYLKALQQHDIPAETEVLSQADRLNEYIMTSLRTMWGIDLDKIKHEHGAKTYAGMENEIQEFIERNWLVKAGNMVRLTTQGKLFADYITSQLFTETPDLG